MKTIREVILDTLRARPYGARIPDLQRAWEGADGSGARHGFDHWGHADRVRSELKDLVRARLVKFEVTDGCQCWNCRRVKLSAGRGPTE